ncbi:MULTISPECIES: DNA topoisomerase IB [Pseudoalteromonas]|jgi:DNA topoisomerase-1|uniref:DNA topoisomerase IB n=1 Tax=Pseudoalteromonas TaxID=53246 RepID=UPI00110AE3DF|nr:MULTISPECIES: DNA topoisomerase IB [Pseudoalteromonas]KAA8596977.1 DNA topoisomerase IB (poxvirus type) [Vibrio cyclitrophicus]MCK8108504.1 DNA topoisomerase IB [Pseudoalteromonas sp. 2CM41L]MCK8117867.1 DNA topoisomerase IB [Pseudoalteromonas sp. 2CM37A]MCK8133147.1 DNA topoisomerase IB [Pseudoalteromonas sp. 2CM28B]MCQ8884928.1 DNA topoisomerase IB [Pseudoalteromonas agarivorans]|tara:strand:- start:46 stop:1023 length:978 start_codon:yes stop_codon:yes gene_type:complete
MKLIYVDDNLPGITRKRKNKTWLYFDPIGKQITDQKVIDRLNALAFPPAYKNAWFCPEENGHILATGIDSKGRKQYRYHEDFRAQQEAKKYQACGVFGNKLPLLRARLENDLQGDELSVERTLAAVVRLMDLGALRVGNERNVKQNKSFGATTLRNRHAKLTGKNIQLRYRAKSGKEREVNITDRVLSHVIKDLQDLPGQHLFQYISDGERTNVTSSEINQYIQQIMGEDFSAKHFRTWRASVIAFKQLVKAKGALSLKSMLESVSEQLGNTPAIARKSYVHPDLIALCKEDEQTQTAWRESLSLPRKTKYLSRYERGFLAFLKD